MADYDPPDHTHSTWTETIGLVLRGAIGACFVWGTAAILGFAWAILRFTSGLLP